MQSNMHKTLFILFALGLLIAASSVRANAKTAAAIIPKPAKMEVKIGAFPLAPGTQIFVLSDDCGARWVGEYLSKLVSPAVGDPVPTHINPNAVVYPGAILLSLQAPHTLGPEGYELAVTPYNVRIEATEAAGLFYGVQTLRQLLPAEIGSHAFGEEAR